MEISSETTPDSLEQGSSKRPNKGIKRNKVSKACNECRKKKVRCNGAQPCVRCQRSGTECSFSSITTKKWLPKEYLEPLESRLKTVDMVLQTMYKNDIQQHVELDPTLTTAMNSLSIASVSGAPYVPKVPSSMSCIDLCQQGPAQPYVEPPRPHLNIKPEAPMRFDLIQCYFDYVHPSIPIIDMSLLADPQPPSLLLSAVYATASRFHPQEQQQTANPPGWSYYKMALSIIDIYLDSPRLSTVQALLLLIKYHEHVQRPGFFWRTRSLLQLAVQMASDLGIAKGSIVAPEISYEVEYCNRTFWALYIYETLMSTEHGFQPFFLPSECTAQYPQYYEGEQESECINATNFHWLSKVIHIQGFVLQFMRSKYGTSDCSLFDEQTEFDDLEKRLKYLGQEIPQIRSANDDLNIYFIHLMYHAVNILLYRPFAFSSSVNDPQYSFYCQSSASSITDIVEHLFTDKGIDVFYNTTRGHQQIIYCLTAAITVQRSAKDTVTYLQPFDLLQYEKTASVLKAIVEKSPMTEIDCVSVSDSQLLIEAKRKQEHVSYSNTSSGRPSPLETPLSCPQSPVSPKITKRMSRSSLKIPSTPDSALYLSPSTGANTPEPTAYQRTHSPTGRLTRKHTRLSAPSLSSLYQQHTNYCPPQLQQLAYTQQQMTSQSQPSSPTSNYSNDIHGTMTSGGPIDQYQHIPSSPTRRITSRKLGHRLSTSFVGDFTIPIQRPTRATSIRRHPSTRRHTVTDSMPFNLLDTMITSPSSFTNDIHSTTLDPRHRYSAPPNTLNLYNIPSFTQPVMMDPSFLMDPVIPDTPTESVMGVLMNTDNNYFFSPQ